LAVDPSLELRLDIQKVLRGSYRLSVGLDIALHQLENLEGSDLEVLLASDRLGAMLWTVYLVYPELQDCLEVDLGHLAEQWVEDCTHL
jgi:hypothetical protein